MDTLVNLEGYTVKSLTLKKYIESNKYFNLLPEKIEINQLTFINDLTNAEIHIDHSQLEPKIQLYLYKKTESFVYDIHLERHFFTYIYSRNILLNLSFAEDGVLLTPYLYFTNNFISFTKTDFTSIRDHLISNTSLPTTRSTLNFNNIFEKIKIKIFKNNTKLNNKEIIPILRPYQKAAVNWMMHREKTIPNIALELNPIDFLKDDNRTLWYYPSLECISIQRIDNVSLYPGGILSDEMGLGKTVEILYLIINHRMFDWQFDQLYKNFNFIFQSTKETTQAQCTCGLKNKKIDSIKCPSCLVIQHKECIGLSYKYNIDSFLCPDCWKLQELLPSKATLIIAPESLFSQWQNEISNHLENGKHPIFFYRGFEIQRYVQPTFLMKQLIVFTTYETIVKDLKYSKVETDNSRFRKPKKYLQPSTPLTKIKWWRICLDEGQRVSTQCQSAIMTTKLESVHRWIVTGTPFQKKVSDVYGLLKFLNLNPEFSAKEFDHLFMVPFENGNLNPITNLLQNIMWRNSRHDVKDQINLPQMHDNTIFLNLSAIEQHIYYCSLEKTREQLNLYIDSLNDISITDPLEANNRKQILKLLQPLIFICTLPGFKERLTTLKELSDSLIHKSKVKCEQLLRTYIASLNGAAGTHILNNSFQEAINTYNHALQISLNYKDSFQTDTFQIIHIKFNLGSLLSSHYKNDPEKITLANKYYTEAGELENQFLSKSYSSIELAKNNLLLTQNILNPNLSPTYNMWWNEALCIALESDSTIFNEETILQYIRTGLETHNFGERKSEYSSSKMINISNVRTCSNLLNLLNEWFIRILNIRVEINNQLNTLESDTSLAEKALYCHLRNGEKRRAKCKICIIEGDLKRYERDLFAKYQRKTETNDGEEQSDLGSWKPSKFEVILKLIYNYTKSQVEEIIPKITEFFKDLENLKKEFKNLLQVWLLNSEFISSKDEIRMCKSRIELSSLQLTEEHSLEFILSHYQIEAQQVLQELNKCSGRYNYFKNIQSNQSPEPCQICSTSLQSEWDFLSCGHSFCPDCISTLKNNNCQVDGNIKCPYCREQTKTNEIYKVVGTKEETKSFTKIEAILKLTKELIEKDPEVKILIFSQGENILDFLGKRLTENDIKHLRFKPALKYQRKLTLFKAKGSHIKIVLMSILAGSKGLNLTEANHIIFLEPLLNPADESQAIGRIYRMGQTKETYIHRFITKRTIEENISSLSKKQRNEFSINHILNILT